MKNEVTFENFQGNTLSIYEGKALDPRYPNRILFSGDIKTVSAFLEKRHNLEDDAINADIKTYAGSQYPEVNKVVVMVDVQAMQITLHLDPENPFGGEIVGKLNMNPDLLKFSINEQRLFNREELVKLLRFNKRFFPNKERYQELLNAYQMLKLSTSTEVEQKSDTRGNKKNLFDKTVDSSQLPDSFVLAIPIFQGQGLESFRVEISLEATDGAVRFWLESVELAELIEDRKRDIIAEETARCEDFVIIYK